MVIVGGTGKQLFCAWTADSNQYQGSCHEGREGVESGERSWPTACHQALPQIIQSEPHNDPQGNLRCYYFHHFKYMETEVQRVENDHMVYQQAPRKKKKLSFFICRLI